MSTDQEIDDTASSMAWTINDELWETAPPHRKAFWREIVKETLGALMLPQAEKEVALEKIRERIERDGIT